MSASCQFFLTLLLFLVTLLSDFEPEEILKHRLVLWECVFFIGNPDSCLKSLSFTNITFSREFLQDLQWNRPSLDSFHASVFNSPGLSSNHRSTLDFNKVKIRKWCKKGGLHSD